MTAARKLYSNNTYLNLLPQAQTWSPLFDQFGWTSLPEELKSAINADLTAFEQELTGRYSYADSGVKSRRQNVRYWIELYLNNEVSLETAKKALTVMV